MTILSQLHRLVNSGHTLESAIDLVIPGADPTFWERKLATYDPNAPKPKRRRSRSRSRKTNKRTFRASSVLTKTTLSTTRQAEARAKATAELVKRVNDQADPETVEVTTPTGQHQILEIRRDYHIPTQLESRPILWQFGDQIIELEVG